MARKPIENPFHTPRVARDKVVSLRLSPDEYDALVALVKTAKLQTIRDALRQGVALLIDHHNRQRGDK